MLKNKLVQKISVISTLIVITTAASSQLQAGTIVQCGNTICTSDFTVTFNGNATGGGQFLYNAASGDISLNTNASSIVGNGVVQNGGLVWMMGDGSKITVSSLYGNADPILGFSVGASTASSGATFSFNFDLPVAIDGLIKANSSVSYSLTSTTNAGAQIAAIGNGKIVSAYEVDTSVGGIGSINKGVDVGDTYFHTGGPLTTNSAVFTANNTFTGDLAYDLMAVKIDFSLSADSAVGISGFVSQVPAVPVPAAAWLFASGLLGLVGVARRRDIA